MFQVNPRIHLKHQALFSSKDKSKKLKCRLLQFLFGPLRVNTIVIRANFSNRIDNICPLNMLLQLFVKSFLEAVAQLIK